MFAPTATVPLTREDRSVWSHNSRAPRAWPWSPGPREALDEASQNASPGTDTPSQSTTLEAASLPMRSFPRSRMPEVPHAPSRPDVSDVPDVRRMVDDVIELWGRVDVLVNNAGITVRWTP